MSTLFTILPAGKAECDAIATRVAGIGYPDRRRLRDALPMSIEASPGGEGLLMTGPATKGSVIAGIGRLQQTAMFVSRGVGTVYVPVRINCPPEVALLTLQPDAAALSG